MIAPGTAPTPNVAPVMIAWHATATPTPTTRLTMSACSFAHSERSAAQPWTPRPRRPWRWRPRLPSAPSPQTWNSTLTDR
jgi:hypothetical protein